MCARTRASEVARDGKLWPKAGLVDDERRRFRRGGVVGVRVCATRSTSNERPKTRPTTMMTITEVVVMMIITMKASSLRTNGFYAGTD